MPQDDSPTAKQQRAPLPESLKGQLNTFRSQLWRVKAAEAILAGCFGLLFSYLLVFGLDRLWATPPLVRLAILIGGTSLFVFFAPYWIHRWVFGHRREDQLARLIARKFPRLGDRLLGVVELQSQEESKDSLSPALRNAAMRSVASQAKGRKFEKALPNARHRSWSLAVIATFAIAGAALVLVPKAGMNALKRWLLPLSDTPRYTFTKIDPFAAEIIVPHGEPFEIELTLSSDSDKRPPNGSARFGIQDPVKSPLLANRSYLFSFPGQAEDGTVSIQIGDARHAIRVIPTTRPTIGSVSANVTYPEYLELKDKRLDLRAGSMSVVVGSQVSLQAKTIENRELDFGTLTVRILPKLSARDVFDDLDGELSSPEEVIEEESPPTDPETFSLRIVGTAMSSPPIVIGDAPTELQLNWRDSYGLDDEGGHRVRVEPLEDQSPTAYIQGVERQLVMLATDTVSFEILTEDDFGVREIGYEWAGQFTKPTDETPSRGHRVLKKGAPDLRRVSETVEFSPFALEIQPQKLVMRAFVEDYFPGRGRLYSEPITVYILTKDEQAQLLKQFDRIIGELEDAARREQNNFDENRRLEQEDAEDLQDEPNQERLEQQESKEGENVEKMEELSERMEKLLSDALRNGEVGSETMQKMAEAMQNMQELSQQDMPQVEQELREAQDDRSTPEQAKKDLQEAIEEQEKVLEKMRKTIESANEANEKFEASTFINRLRRAASEENGIAATLVKAIEADRGESTIVGLSIEELDPADQRIVGELSMQQRRTASDVRWIQEDLGHFYARTQKEEHKELMEAMRTSQIDSGLEETREKIAMNRTFEAIGRAKKWAAKLTEWADILDPPKDSSAGGGDGEGGNDQGLDDNDFEFMLKIMKMIQTEQDIRARTRALEQLRRTLHLQDAPKDDKLR
jgi:hypothetical protein